MKFDSQNHSKSTKWHGMGYLYLSLLIFMLMPTLTGCQDYHWMFDDFKTAEQQAREQHKDLFIFYKWWLSNESNRMHSEVLPDPQVWAHLKDTVNLIMERDSSPGAAHYMSKYGITSAPAFVVANPKGAFKTCTGYIPKERFIEFLKNAKSPPPTTQQKNAKTKSQ